VAVTVKSAPLSFASVPSGSRMSLEPGAAVVGGAGAGRVSTSVFVAVPYPTESTSVPAALRRPTPPAAEAIPAENDWFGAFVPA
jgi:hypothetical protein